MCSNILIIHLFTALHLPTDPNRVASPPSRVPSLIKSSSHPEYLFVESFKEEEEEAKTFHRQYAKRGMKFTPRSPEKATSRGDFNSAVGKSKDSNAAVAKSPSEPVEKQPVLKHPQIRFVSCLSS